MKPLAAVQTEDGDSNPLVTDLDFVDIIISSMNYALPVYMPYDLLEKHEEEREVTLSDLWRHYT